jgi:hypothetical protein
VRTGGEGPTRAAAQPLRAVWLGMLVALASLAALRPAAAQDPAGADDTHAAIASPEAGPDLAVPDTATPDAAVVASAAAAPRAAPAPLAVVAGALDPSGRLRLAASMRLRYELVRGQPRPRFNDRDDLINLRTTLLAEYDFGRLRLGGELWDSRVWAAQPGTPVTNNEVNTVEPVQLYALLDLAGSTPGQGAVLQLGRFTLNLGSRRLVSADDYRNTTSGYTGVRLDLAGNGVRATTIYVLPQRRLPNQFDDLVAGRVRLDREDFNLVLWGGVASMRAFGATEAEFSFFHADEDRPAERPSFGRSLDTIGGRLVREPAPGVLDHELEGYYQWGEVRDGLGPATTRVPVAAGFIHAEAGFTGRDPWRTRVAFEFDLASGDRPGGRFTRFDTLFGMRRADFGPSGLYSAIGRANILSPALRVETVPSSRLDLFGAWRPMWLASRTDAFATTGVRDPSGQSGRFAGHQVEGRLRWWAMPTRLRAEVGALWLAKGPFLRDAPNAPRNGDSCYVSFNLTASI